MKTCRFCEHCYIDMNNNYRCDIKDYTESNIVRINWGQWKVDADKCSTYKRNNHESKEKELK